MKITIAITNEDGIWIARCLDYLITQTGKTKQGAINHMIESLKQHMNEFDLKKVSGNKEQYQDWEIVEIEIS